MTVARNHDTNSTQQVYFVKITKETKNMAVIQKRKYTQIRKNNFIESAL